MQLVIRKPDDLHVHLRDGAMLEAVAPATAERFARAIVMPNLARPVSTVRAALAYRRRILAALPPDADFEPLMTLYLTDTTSAAEVRRAADDPRVHAVKYYPAGATTRSDSGVTDLARVYPVLEAMQEARLPLLIHGESTDPKVDVFDRERVFVERILAPLAERLAELRIVLEHVTTSEGVDFVLSHSGRIGATITAHHLLLDRNALFHGGLRPHHYCLPVLKRNSHRRSLIAAATSGDPRFFLGTDSAPHPRTAKLGDRGCAGIYTAHAALELYAEAFEAAGALDRLEAFAAVNGARFYGLPLTERRIQLRKRAWTVPASLTAGRGSLIPFRAGEQCAWQLDS